MNNVLEIRKRAASPGAVRTIALLSLSWAALLLAGAFVAGFHAADTALFFSLFLRVALIGGMAAALLLYLPGDLASGYRGFKAFVGYGIVFSYIAGALPPAAWSETGDIGTAASWFGWAWAALASLPGLVLYVLLCTPAWRVELGIFSKADVEKKVKYRPAKPRTFLGKVLDTADAIVQAILIVAVIHMTLFQLYVIPSGSMIPKFLIGDRVIVTKLQSGPRIPLSPVKLPTLSAPKRGDIIVFDNPFSEKPPLVKRMWNTFVFYISLANVNLDTATGGEARVGTVVKRLVGMPGEKLMMLDDKLYVRTASSSGWEPQADDAKWANYDIYALPDSLKSRMDSSALSFTKEDRAGCDAIDSWRRGTTIAAEAAALDRAAAPLAAAGSNPAASLGAAARSYLADGSASYFASYDQAAQASGGALSLIRSRAFRIDATLQRQMKEDVQLFLWAVSSPERYAALRSFLSAAPADLASGSFEDDPYGKAGAILNLRAKELMARRCSFYLSLLRSGDVMRLAKVANFDPSSLGADRGIFSDWTDFISYMVFFDMRSFPEFPAGKGNFIERGHYFLMGDNRYGSLDFRYSHKASPDNYAPRSLDSADPDSAVYESSLDMHSLDGKAVLGKVMFTFWPPR